MVVWRVVLFLPNSTASRDEPVQVRPGTETFRAVESCRWWSLERVAAVAFAGPAGKDRLVAPWRDGTEAMLCTGMVGMKEPRERKRGAAKRTLRFVNSVDADPVEVMLAGCTNNSLHHQWLRAQGTIHAVVNSQGIACPSELQPLQLLRRLKWSVLLRAGWQCLEEVVRDRPTAAAAAGRGTLLQHRAACNQNLDKFANVFLFDVEAVEAVLVASFRCLAREVGVEEACEDAFLRWLWHAGRKRS
mmetsp:Transcript_71302/g.166929  ORF Transcript_71302/g.166929 Transcript_71302/m.166929 type:complete len:245 (-) Transcript_71302:900-1634(-)